MTHRDHIALGFIVYSGTVMLGWHCDVPEFTGLIGRYSLPGFAAYLGGVSFPDTDLYLWPHLASGHRTRSILHRMDYPLVLTLIFALLSVYMQSWLDKKLYVDVTRYYFIPALMSAFTFGWFVHLIGDFIQGGVKFGFGSKGRIGITSFKWDAYTGWLGSIFSTFLKMAGLSVLGYFLTMYGIHVFGNHIRLIVVGFLTVQAISFSSAIKFEASLFIYSVIAVCAAYGGLNF